MQSPIILVTGSNRGIGFSIVQSTALRVPDATYILACRSHDAGMAAVQELKALGVTAVLDVVVLDVTDDASIVKAMETVQEKYLKIDSKFTFTARMQCSETDQISIGE